ncbi:MAG: hypothetical protein KW806_00235 [Candidatus Yanofskybacteria bacterium]|nr:hypothetical protein [Candidatus Yanofskybacteria bacterium]
MKTLFITAFNPFISRNILNSDVLRELKKGELRIVIFALPDKVNFLEKYYGGPNVIFEGVDLEDLIRSSTSRFWHRLAFLIENTQYVRDQRKEQLEKNKTFAGYLNYFWISLVSEILSRLPFIPRLYRHLDFKYVRRGVLQEQYQQYQPSLLFSTDIFGEYDIVFMRDARQNGVPIIGMVRSWDNPTTKGIVRLMPDQIIVNGKIAKEELHRIHGASWDTISVVGLPQFDQWLSGPTISREDFFSGIGADSSKRLILFAPAGSILSDTDWQTAEIIKKAMDAKKLPSDLQILVRNHPHHPADFSKFSGDNRFIFEIPGQKIAALTERQAELSPDDNSHLRNSVYYSDLVMYVATSLGLDSCVYDKPQILISFDGWEQRPYIRSVRRYNQEDCLGNLVKTGGTAVAYSEQQLLHYMNEYLENPKKDHEGRQRIIETQMHILDGQAGKRCAEIILTMLQSAHA